MIPYDYTRELTRSIISHPFDHEWTTQGLGMLRTYLSDEVRLHVWDQEAQVDDVTSMHTHPWDFFSLIVSGRVVNQRYKTVDADRGKIWMCQKIKCGQGGGPTRDPERVRLKEGPVEIYTDDMAYAQRAQEIHESRPDDGTVTIIRRAFLKDTEHAFVYYPVGGEWVSAEPRTATKEEIMRACAKALKVLA